MFAPKNLLCAALAAGLFFSASNAEARFGKRSNSSDSEQQKEEKKKKDKEERRESPAPRVHDASAVNSSSTHGASPVGSSRPPPPPRVVVVEPAPEPDYYAPPPPSYYVTPVPNYVAPAPSVEVHSPRKDTLYSPLRLGLEAGSAGGGAQMNLSLAIEGEQLGLEGRLTGLALPTDDGSGGSDSITVTGVHLTYALVAQDRLRWRVEAGFTSAHAPDLIVYGPSLGTSFEARLGGPLDFELRLQGTPFPYRQADAQAALALKLNPWVLRAGWRTLLLDDAGLVDGEVHRDVFSGPFVGAGLIF